MKKCISSVDQIVINADAFGRQARQFAEIIDKHSKANSAEDLRVDARAVSNSLHDALITLRNELRTTRERYAGQANCRLNFGTLTYDDEFLKYYADVPTEKLDHSVNLSRQDVLSFSGFEDAMNEIDRIVRDLPNDFSYPENAWDHFKTKLTEIKELLDERVSEESLKSEMADLKSKETDALKDALTAVGNYVTNLREQSKSSEAEFENVNNVLKKREEQATNELGLNVKLFWAIFGMMGLLAALFVSLKLFSEKVSTQLIQERTLVESISVAFLVLALIILGTGRILASEALGTLLGTIAGYIFGRKADDFRREYRATPGLQSGADRTGDVRSIADDPQLGEPK